MSNLYLENGYINCEYVLSYKLPITIVIGGRGTGKTFGMLDWCIQHDQKIIFMRRTQGQTDLINKPEFSPINPVAAYRGLKATTKPISKYNSGIYLGDPEEEEPRLLGFTAALSTFSNLRGFDASGVELLIYDEFIPEKHERPIKGEGDAFLNVYETVNRNRELQGRRPLRAVLLSNANRLDSPILAALDLVKVVDRMTKKGQCEYINNQSGIGIFLLMSSPISQQKGNTQIYKLTAGSNFAKMSLANAFAYDDMSDVRSLPLAGWKLQAQLGDYFIYKKDRQWYISAHCSGSPRIVYQNTEIDLRRFVRDNPSCLSRILNHKILYESFEAKSFLTNLYM